MRFGVSMPNAGDPADLVDLAALAEEAGWDGFFLWDHLQYDAADRPPMHDPWVLLGAIAVRTRHVRLGTMVTSPRWLADAHGSSPRRSRHLTI